MIVASRVAQAISTRPPLEVLVIGCGCSGTLFAKRFRDQVRSEAEVWDKIPKSKRTLRPNLDDNVCLTMWDWARGPAGRMSTFHSCLGAGPRQVADVGAQVLSVRSCSDEELLRDCGAVDAFGLSPTTCQRPSDATHLWMPGGLTRLLLMQIKDALPDDVAFNRRVLSVMQRNQQWEVEAEVSSPPHWLAKGRFQTGRYQPEHGQTVTKQTFDAVVLAVTAKDALAMQGVKAAVGHKEAEELDKVVYDSRLSVTLMLSASLRQHLEVLFANGQSELDFECCLPACSHGVLGLLSYQDRKLRLHPNCTVLVAHSTSSFARENLQAARDSHQGPEEHGLGPVLNALASKVKVSQQFLQEAVLDYKVIHWHQGQVKRFVSGGEDCVVVPGYKTKVPGPLLALCGDYFTEASFAGCSRSATAAANAVTAWVVSRLAL